MADYDAIIDAEIEPDQPVTTSLMYRLRDNPIAIAEGATGAPQIQQAGIADGAVGTAQLKTTTGNSSSSSSVPGGSVASGVFTLPGGQYAFLPQWRKTSGTGLKPVALYSDQGQDSVSGSLATICPWARWNNSASPDTIGLAVTTRYIQSSPPYDHGDGIVQGYVYALIENGAVIETYMAEDPPWYGNTRQSPREQFVRDGKVYGRFHKPSLCLGDLKAGRVSLGEFREKAGRCEVVEEEITSANKLRGMDELPHPFYPKDGQTVVLLDPMDELTGRMIAMMQAGESAADLFYEDYLRVDNTALNRKGPPTVPIHAAKWR